MGMGPRAERRAAGQGQAAGGVIPAKVRVPRVRWLPRERLDKLMPQLWVHRLGLVIAPAGSGKTTLLAAWAATSVTTTCFSLLLRLKVHSSLNRALWRSHASEDTRFSDLHQPRKQILFGGTAICAGFEQGPSTS